MASAYVWSVLLIMAAVTLLERAAPFLAARWLQRWPLIAQLGRFLPPAIMALLLLHTLRGSMLDNPAGPWQEILAAAVAIALQWRTRRPLLSILGATLLYVLLRNSAVFGGG